MARVTQAELDTLVRQVNEALGRPIGTWTRHDVPCSSCGVTHTAQSRYTANVGNIHLSQAYGGVQVVEVINDEGGMSQLTYHHGTKREAALFLRGMLAGIERVRAS